MFSIPTATDSTRLVGTSSEREVYGDCEMQYSDADRRC